MKKTVQTNRQRLVEQARVLLEQIGAGIQKHVDAAANDSAIGAKKAAA